jgi:hypothetical protein
LVAEVLSVDPITISQQISRCCVERKGFEDLLRSPLGRRMSRDVKVDNAVVGHASQRHADGKVLRASSAEQSDFTGAAFAQNSGFYAHKDYPDKLRSISYPPRVERRSDGVPAHRISRRSMRVVDG